MPRVLSMSRAVWVVAIVSCCLATGGTRAEQALTDILYCNADVLSGVLDREFGDRLCAAASAGLGARLVAKEAFESAVAGAGASKIASRLDLTIRDARTIRYAFATGSPQQWSAGGERRFEDLIVDIQDAELNESAIKLLVDTIRHLSRQGE